MLEKSAPWAAIQGINDGRAVMTVLFEEYEADEHFEYDELIRRFIESRAAILAQRTVGETLQDQWADALVAEEHALAAKLRDELAQQRCNERSGVKPRKVQVWQSTSCWRVLAVTAFHAVEYGGL